MRKYWNTIFGLDCERSIWIEEEDLGREKVLYHKNKRYFVKIPQIIDKTITLRLKGFGKTRFNKTGNLFLHVWLNKGEDVRKNLWLSETTARNGGDKRLLLDEKKITMVIPPKSYNGLTIRLKGLGSESSHTWHAPVLHRKRGNLFVKLFVYPDNITPNYGSFEALSTDDMFLEGWVYRKIDEVILKMGKSSFLINPIQAGTVADLFNERGWRGIFDALVDHLKLANLNIGITKSNFISLPGSCEKTANFQDNTFVAYKYTITINEQFLDNPFSIAAIMAHELCHVIHSEKIDNVPKLAGPVIKTEQATMEEEHTVDLLAFMFKIGEFQLRVARDQRLTLGYFNQGIFERIQVIVSKKFSLH
jgi:hypothetical protein